MGYGDLYIGETPMLNSIVVDALESGSVRLWYTAISTLKGISILESADIIIFFNSAMASVTEEDLTLLPDIWSLEIRKIMINVGYASQLETVILSNRPSMQYLYLWDCTKLKELRLVAVGDPKYNTLKIDIESVGALRRVHLELTGAYIPFHYAP